MKYLIPAQLLTATEAAEQYPDAFEIEDGDITGFRPRALDGESDFYDCEPDDVLVIPNPEGGAPLFIQSALVGTALIPFMVSE